MLNINEEEGIEDRSSKTDHVPHLLSPYYNSQCVQEVQETTHHQEQTSQVHEILLLKWGKQTAETLLKKAKQSW